MHVPTEAFQARFTNN